MYYPIFPHSMLNKAETKTNIEYTIPVKQMTTSSEIIMILSALEMTVDQE